MPYFSIPRFYQTSNEEEIYNSYSIKNAIEKLDDNWKLKIFTDIFHTPISKEFLSWRYADCPVAKYGAIIIPNKLGLIFRIKKLNRFIELRICEVWTEHTEAEDELNKLLQTLKKEIKPLVISYTNSPQLKTKNHKIKGFYGPSKRGPVVTLKPLSLSNLNIFEDFSRWNPSLGTMELF
jgi:hypothetical protein